MNAAQRNPHHTAEEMVGLESQPSSEVVETELLRKTNVNWIK